MSKEATTEDLDSQKEVVEISREATILQMSESVSEFIAAAVRCKKPILYSMILTYQENGQKVSINFFSNVNNDTAFIGIINNAINKDRND